MIEKFLIYHHSLYDMANPISREIFVHQINNPLGPDLGYNLKILMLNENLFSLTNFVKGYHKTKCSLNITDYNKLDMPNDQAGIEIFYNKLLLSFNLVLKRFVMLPFDIIYSRVQIGSEQISAVVGSNESIDENDVSYFFTRINALYQKPTSDIPINNLKKSLIHYQTAMESNMALLIFKNLYNSLELVGDVNGLGLIDSALDAEIASISGVDASKAEEWRRFYNRIKHVDKNTNQLIAFSDGTNNLKDYVKESRVAAQLAIRNRL